MWHIDDDFDLGIPKFFWRIRWDLNPGLSAFLGMSVRRPTRFMA